MGYDHHCKWINNCVGTKNYNWFILLLFSVEVYNLKLLTTLCLMFYAYDSDSLNFGSVKRELVLGFWIALGLMSVIALYFNTFLLVFHMYLRLKGLTTFDFNNRKTLPTLEKTDANFISVTDSAVDASKNEDNS